MRFRTHLQVRDDILDFILTSYMDFSCFGKTFYGTVKLCKLLRLSSYAMEIKPIGGRVFFDFLKFT